MEAAELVQQILASPEFRDISMECRDSITVGDCTQSLWEAVGGLLPANDPTVLKPTGGIFHIQQVPVLFLHCAKIANELEEPPHLAECAMFLFATEMFFAAQDIYPVVFLVEGGSPTFWKYMDIYQRRVGNLNIYKVRGHSLPVIVPYTSHADALDLVRGLLIDSLDALAVPPAER
jgi:hypothetical protein